MEIVTRMVCTSDPSIAARRPIRRGGHEIGRRLAAHATVSDDEDRPLSRIMRRRSGSILDDSAWQDHRRRNATVAAAIGVALFVGFVASVALIHGSFFGLDL
jgi:hypothetical protein